MVGRHHRAEAVLELGDAAHARIGREPVGQGEVGTLRDVLELLVPEGTSFTPVVETNSIELMKRLAQTSSAERARCISDARWMIALASEIGVKASTPRRISSPTSESARAFRTDLVRRKSFLSRHPFPPLPTALSAKG
jgi:hypothetical protein